MTKSPDRKEIGKTVFGIYSVEGDRLALCAGEIGKAERPASFVPTNETS